MRLRFFNTFEPVAPLYRDLLPVLCGTGHQVEVVVASAAYRPGEQREAAGGIDFRLIPTPDLSVRVVGKAATHGCYAGGASLYSLVGGAVDVNVFLTQPPLFAGWGRVLQRVRRQPYVCVVMDLYPWFAVEAGVLPRGARTTRWLCQTTTRTLQGAQSVIVIGRCMASRMEQLGVPPERIHVVPNWANTAIRPVPPEDNALRAELGIGSRRVVMYSGNMGVGHGFRTLLEVAKRMSGDGQTLFVLVGGGRRRADISRQVAREGLPNVVMLDYQPVERLSESLSLADVHYVCLRRGFEGLSVPSKAYGALAAGRPIVYEGSPDGEIGRMVRERGVGLVVEPEDAGALERGIRSLLDDERLRSDMGTRARAAATDTYSRARGVAGYERVLVGAGSTALS